MKNIYLIFVLFLGSCAQYDIVDTGIARRYTDCTMWEYFHRDSYNWDSVIVAIEHAGIQDVFDGTNPDYKEITFFGVTGWSVKMFINHALDGDGNRLYPGGIRDMPREQCRDMILSHVIPGKHFKDGFNYEIKNTHEGGTDVVTLTGDKLRVFRTTSDFMKVPDAGPEGLGIESDVTQQMVMVASADNEMKNGVVHSLVYEYEWTKLY